MSARESEIREIVAGVLNVPASELTPEAGPKTIPQWDSLAHVTVVAAVEQSLGLSFSMPEILSIRSLSDLEQLVVRQTQK